jgi:hypothetical protein
MSDVPDVVQAELTMGPMCVGLLQPPASDLQSAQQLDDPAACPGAPPDSADVNSKLRETISILQHQIVLIY